MSIFHSKAWRVFDQLGNLVLLSLVFLVSCLPVFTIGPAVSALMHTCFMLRKHKDVPLLATYRQGFRQNFRQAAISWLIVLFLLFDLFLIFTYCYRTGLASMPPCIFLFILAGILVLFPLKFLFAIICYFDCNIQQGFTNAFVTAFANLGWTLCMLLKDIAFGVLLFFAPFSFIVIPGAVSWIDSRIMLRAFSKVTGETLQAKDQYVELEQGLDDAF